MSTLSPTQITTDSYGLAFIACTHFPYFNFEYKASANAMIHSTACKHCQNSA